MKRIETVRLQPADPAQLLAWLERFNEAANWLSGVAFREHLWHWLPLQRRAYRDLRERFQLPSAAAVVAIRKVAYAYGNTKCRHHQVTFRRRGAVPIYGHRYKRDGTVLLYGFRVPFAVRAEARLSSQSQAVLCYRRGKFILHQAVEVDVPEPATVDDYLGCDLGTVNLLTDSEQESYSGQAVEAKRRIYAHRRQRLQQRGTRAARRKLRGISGRQGRYQRDTNHGIAKRVVAKAQRLCCGIALENLRGIRSRITARRRQRAQLHNWSFGQLRQFIVYKAARNIRAWARGDAPMVASARTATSPASRG